MDELMGNGYGWGKAEYHKRVNNSKLEAFLSKVRVVLQIDQFSKNGF